MKKNLLLIAMLMASSQLFAQNQPSYKQKAEQVRKDVWGNRLPGFDLKDAPDSLKNESAVVLARSIEVSRSSASRLKFMIVTAASTTRTTRTTTFHERVKINDKAALDDYSTLEYQKRLDESRSLLIAKVLNVHDTYIGVKILKPDGKEIVVNTEEEVLVKDQQKDKQGKLAISGLEVGDVIDYYIYSLDMIESGFDDNPADNRYVVFLSGNHPILNLNLSFQYNSKVTVKTLYANGAPKLNSTTNKDGDQIYAVQLTNLPKRKDELWSSTYRQSPYFIISSKYDNKVNNAFAGVKATKANRTIGEIVTEDLGNYFNAAYYPYDSKLEKAVKDKYDGMKKFKAMPLDSTMRFLYDKWKHTIFCSYDGKNMDMSNERNGRTANGFYNASWLSRTLNELEVSHDILIGSSRFRASLDNLDDYSPLEVLIRVNGPKPIYMNIENITTDFNAIPSDLEGERIVVASPKRKNARETIFSTKEEVLPVSAAESNHTEERIKANFAGDNMQKLSVSRTVKSTGALSSFEKIRLLQIEDIDRELTALTGSDPLEKRLKASGLTKKMQDDYEAAFVKAKSEVKQNFINEIKGQFDLDPLQVSDFKVISSGIRHGDALEYSAKFEFDNLVKRAGVNLIIDAGKLIGKYTKLDDDERKRSTDIYMPCARSFQFVVEISIPKGYVAKGLEQFNTSVSNASGNFIGTAVQEGNVLKINVSRGYKNNFEKAGEWPKVLELMDAVYSYTNQKILLERSI